MCDYIILVKQVPDVARITDNAFDPDSGNLVRARLASVINELDAQALAFSWRMRELAGESTARIICLSMGPPMAAEVLRYGLARQADAAVLLTDRALGGADTVATANPLAHAISKIKQEMLNGSEDYFVVCGMQSVDGDTAQVPPQIAEELGIACLPYATGIEYHEDRFHFHLSMSGGTQVVECLRMPAVITVAKYDFPLYPSFGATRRARHEGILQWGADDVKPTAMGSSGSRTRVIRVFPPARTSRLCRRVSSIAELAELLGQALHREDNPQQNNGSAQEYLLPARRLSWFDRSFEGTEKEQQEFQTLADLLSKHQISSLTELNEEAKEKIKADPEMKFSEKNINWMLDGLSQVDTAYSGEVWVMAEHAEGKLNNATFELIGKSRELADSLEVEVGVVLLGNEIRELVPGLFAAGADKVYLCENSVLADFDPLSWRKVTADIFSAHQPQIFLFGATPQGRVLAPMVSYRVGCGLTADCTELKIRDISRQSQIAVLMQTRPALGGNIMATICSRKSPCQMATARPGVMRRLSPNPERRGEIIEHHAELSREDLSLKILRKVVGSATVNFNTDVVLCGGKGLTSKDNFINLLDELADTIRTRFSVMVAKGATRAAVEQGFAERALQIGQTGTAVSPRLYLAAGVSGAIQHMAGVAGSGSIIAINADPSAPVFDQCDYYMVGQAEQLIPELINKLKDSV